MWEIDPLIDLDPTASAPAQRGAGEITETVDREAGSLIESGKENRGSKVREVMFDMMNLRLELDCVGLGKGFGCRGSAANVLNLLPHQARVRQMGQDKAEPAPVVDPGAAIDRDVVDVSY